ncbi:MAG: hypothetical protein ACOYXC_05070 [Candidatus Rifleibacteriota bacterium]
MQQPDNGPLFVTISAWYWFVMIICLPLTLGVGTIIMWWVARYRYPRVIDENGIVKRNGKAVFWKDLVRCHRTTLTNKRGQRISGAVDLYFGNEIVKINPVVFVEGFEVLKAVSRFAGQKIEIG